jgi:heat shock protein HslJ
VPRALSLGFLLALLLAGTAEAAGSPSLAGKTWELKALSGRHEEPQGASARFTVGGKVSGFAGCNSFSGTYTASGRSISISGKLAVTMKACEPDVMKAEQAYLGALTSARRYAASEDGLKLKSRLGRTLASFGVQSQSLAGTSWKVVSYNNGKGAVTSVTAGANVTAVFGEGTVTGSGGCNSYDATVKTTAPGKIEVGPVSATRKACSTPEGVMEQEAAYLAALQSAAAYRLEGDHLELRTADGAIAATLQRA